MSLQEQMICESLNEFLKDSSAISSLRDSEGFLDDSCMEKMAPFLLSGLRQIPVEGPSTMSQRAGLMRKALIEGKIGKNIADRDKTLMLFALYGIKKFHEEKKNFKETIAGHPQFSHLDADQAWRLMIDFSATDPGQHEGLRFENEPGYIAGMYKSLGEMLKRDLRGEKLDAAMMVELRTAAVDDVIRKSFFCEAVDKNNPKVMLLISKLTDTTRNVADRASPLLQSETFFMPGIAYGGKNYFGFDKTNMTKEGFQETIARFNAVFQSSGKYDSFLTIRGDNKPIVDPNSYDQDTEYVLYGVTGKTPEESVQRMDRILQKYRAASARVTLGEDQKLHLIATCCRELEQAHPFADGNARTVGFVVVNKLLLEAGLSPAVIEDPNRFDGYSIAQLVEEIKRGQAHFRELTSSSQTQLPQPVAS